MLLSVTGTFALALVLFLLIKLVIAYEPSKLVRNDRELKKKLAAGQGQVKALQSKIAMLERQIKEMKPVYDRHRPKPKPPKRPSPAKGKGFRISKYFINIKKTRP